MLKEISLSFYYGAKIGIIGVNGSGKSTLMKIMAGHRYRVPGRGLDRIGPNRRVSVRRSRGSTNRSTSRATWSSRWRARRNCCTEFEEVSAKFGEPLSDEAMEKLLERQAKLQDQIDAINAWELDRQLEIAMDALRLPPGDAMPSTLSGGERRRVALCKLLLEKPDLLLLDEPTNHLDAESVAWLERHLREYKGSVILVTHDRYFLDNVVGWILEIDRSRGIPWKGNYSSWLDQKMTRLAQEEKEESVRQRRLKKELDWIHSSQKARQAKGKARLNAYEELRNLETHEKITTASIIIPAGTATRQCRDQGRKTVESVRRQRAVRKSEFRPAARRHRGGDRRERHRKDDAPAAHYRG